MTEITYKDGNLFKLIPKDREIVIPHITNDFGAWGAGFVMPLGENFPKAREVYLKHKGVSCVLGDTQFVKTTQPDYKSNAWIANMCAQHGLISKNNPHPIKYWSLVFCMQDIAEFFENENWDGTKRVKPEIHCAKFGSGLAGGNWDIIHELIRELWLDAGFNITIYTL